MHVFGGTVACMCLWGGVGVGGGGLSPAVWRLVDCMDDEIWEDFQVWGLGVWVSVMGLHLLLGHLVATFVSLWGWPIYVVGLLLGVFGSHVCAPVGWVGLCLRIQLLC